MQTGNTLSLTENSVSLCVTPEILVGKSSETVSKVNAMKRHFDELRVLIDKTKSYWIGEAGDKHRQMYYDLEKDTEEVLKRLGEYPEKLTTIARQYSDVEFKIQQAIQELPGDVIV